MNDDLRERAKRFLDLHYRDGQFEILAVTEILWSGWECDSLAALVRFQDGAVKVIRPDGTAFFGDREDTVSLLEDRIVEYERIVRDTREFLRTAWAAMEGDDHE